MTCIAVKTAQHRPGKGYPDFVAIILSAIIWT